MNHTKLSKYLSWLFIAVVCSGGCLVQVGHVTSRHFEYQTMTIVEFFVPDKLVMPYPSMCFRVHDVLNETKAVKFRNRTGLIRRLKSGQKGFIKILDDYYRDSADFTMENWFNFTPLIKPQLLQRCTVRLPSHYKSGGVSQQDCFNGMKIIKYFDREFICYQFQTRFSNQTMNLVEYTMTPGATGQMYELFVNNNDFSLSDWISISVHSNDSSYLYSTVFSSSHQTGSMRYKFDVHYQEIQRSRLPEPFDTKCVPIPGKIVYILNEYIDINLCCLYAGNFATGLEQRLDYVNRKSMERLGLVLPFVAFTNSSSQARRLNVFDFRNRTLVEELNQIFATRKSLIECNTKYFITLANKPDFASNHFGLTLYWPQNDRIRVQYSPQSEVIDYIIYIGSCIGTWFGFSALSFVDGIQYVSRSLRYSPDDAAKEEEEKKKAAKEYVSKLQKDMKDVKIQLAIMKGVINC